MYPHKTLKTISLRNLNMVGLNSDSSKKDGDVGFDSIYESHSRRTWSSFYSPFLVGLVSMITSEMLITYPLITTASPGDQF